MLKRLSQKLKRTGLWSTGLLLGVWLIITNLSSISPGHADQLLKTHYEPANIEALLSKPNAIPVKVGAYIENYHDLNLQSRRFTAEGYYWAEWPEELQDILVARNLNASDMLEITNQIDEWDSKIRVVGSGEPTKLENGNFYLQTRFSANIYIPDLELRRSPFETLSLPITIETQDDSLALQTGNVVLVPSQGKDSLVGSYAEIDGYRIKSTTIKPMVHTYGTNWGLNQGNLTYSTIQVTTTLESSIKAAFGIYVLPLLIVVGIVLLAPSLAGDLGDVRLAIPSTGLLTMIFLQQAYRATLPALDYLTFLDWLYACSYLISIATFILFVWGTNVYQAAPEGQKEATLARINKIDLVFQNSCVGALAFTAILAWLAY